MKKDVSHEIVESMLVEAGLIEGKVGRIALGYLKGYGSAIGGLIPGIGLILGAAGGALFGHTVQQRVNSMYYECKNIKGYEQKKKCRLQLLDLVIGIQKKKLQDKNITEKQREKLMDSISRYHEAKSSILGSGRGEGTLEGVTSLDEAATGGWWKGLLLAPIIGAVAQSRIERSLYHCKELSKNEQPACQKKVLSMALSILKPELAKDPYNNKLRKKVQEIKQRLGDLGQFE